MKRAEHGLGEIDLRLEAERFANHWASKAGGNAVHVDWKKTWLNWATSDKQGPYRNGSGNGRSKLATSHDSFFTGVGDLISEIRTKNSS